MARKTKAQIRKEKQTEIAEWIAIPILLGLMVLGLLRSGIVGAFLYDLERYLFGSLFYVYMIAVVILIGVNKISRRTGNSTKSPFPVILLIIAGLLLCTWFENPQLSGTAIVEPYIRNITSYFGAQAVSQDMTGGILGAFLYAVCETLFGRSGVIVVVVVLVVISSFLLFSVDVYKSAAKSVYSFLAPPEKEIEETVEEEKEPANLWTMIDEHRERKRQKLGEIKADDLTVEKDDTDLLIQEENREKPVLQNEPYMSRLVNIKADDTKEEIPVVHIPGKTISDSRSVFINVDDLNDPFDTGMEDNASLLQQTSAEPFVDDLADTQPISTVEIQDEAVIEEPVETQVQHETLPVEKKTKKES